MKTIFLFLLPTLFLSTGVAAQSTTMKEASSLPYHQIPDSPESYTAATVAARLVDGLGFRYYWATDGLREEDLQFRPTETARTSRETLEHIHGLSRMIANAVKNQPNHSSAEQERLSFEQLRHRTLGNFKQASEILRTSQDGQLAEYNIIFQRGEETSEYPFWNLINGPIADAIWHVGQVVSLRRASGNPFNPKVSVFSGRVRE